MAKYSRTTLATIAALQKRRKPPIPVKEKAIVSHLYPFKYNEESNVTSDYAISDNLDGGSLDVSTVGFAFNLEKFSSIYRISERDSYDTNTKLGIVIEKIADKIVELDITSGETYDTDTKLGINIDKISLTYVEMDAEDSYNTDTVLSISVTKV